MNKSGLLAGLTILVCACGGSDKKEFTYGAPTAPTTSADQAAVSSAGDKLYSAIQLQGSTTLDPSTAMGMFGTLDLSSLFSTPTLRAPFTKGKLSFASASDSGVVFNNPDCLGVTATTITYSNCSLTFDGESMTINGSVSVSASAVTWSLTMIMDISSESASVNVTASGHYAFTTTSVSGSSSTAMSITMPQGQFGVEVDENVNVTFDAIACDSFITGGTYELQLLWTSVPGAYADQAQDRAIRVSWQSCGTALISHSL